MPPILPCLHMRFLNTKLLKVERVWFARLADHRTQQAAEAERTELKRG